VTELIKNEFKVELCTRSVRKYMKKGCIGVLPQRRGPKGKIDKCHYKNLCLAFDSFVVLNQLNEDARILTSNEQETRTTSSEGGLWRQCQSCGSTSTSLNPTYVK
jgi:hypothetical protein